MNRHTTIFGILFANWGNPSDKRRSALGLAGIIFLGLSAHTSLASVVGNCRAGAHYPTIQAAVKATAAGGTISICPGTYPEQVSISKNLDLTSIATGSAESVVIAAPAAGVIQNASDLYEGGSPIAAQILVQTGSIVNLSNITVDGANNQISGCAPNLIGIYYQNSSGTINHVVTRNQALSTDLDGCQSGLGIYVESGYTVAGNADVTIENSSVHGYQKNGITVDGTGSTAVISGNYIIGQGPTTGAAENGIQVSDGATGTVLNNKVVDDVYTPATYGAAGILIYDSGSLTIESNTVSNTQYGITVYSDGNMNADSNTIVSNSVSATHLDDGIDVCSNGNTIKSNTVFSSDGAGIHIDSTCSEGGVAAGNGNTVTSNTINEACAGVLLGNGTGNATSKNVAYNVSDPTFAGDACPASDVSSVTSRSAKHRPQRFR